MDKIHIPLILHSIDEGVVPLPQLRMLDQKRLVLSRTPVEVSQDDDFFILGQIG